MTGPMGGVFTPGGAPQICPRALPAARLLRRPTAIKIINPFFTVKFLPNIFTLGLLLLISLRYVLIIPRFCG
jgi:hypothetical protein